MTTVVLTDFVASDAYQADLNVVSEGMKNISNIKGVIACVPYSFQSILRNATTSRLICKPSGITMA
jgi:hypothetical protein